MVKIEICSVAGYSEIGRNMTAVKVDDEVIIMDMGIQLDNYIQTVGEDEPTKYSREQLIEKKAIPDDRTIKDWKSKVKAIVITHAHLDHIGAVPYLANHYNCPIIGTPYTMEILKAIVRDNDFKLKNKIKTLSVNSKYIISKNIAIELINVTHSIPQTAIIALHTPNGVIMYANDFKFDMFPVLGKKTTPERFAKLSPVLALIVDSLYADQAMKTPSESIAKAMLKDVLIGTNSEKRAIVVSTFSSHIARLTSIVKYGKELGRKIVFIGRSLARYTEAAERINLVNFSKDVHIVKFKSHARKMLKKIEKNRDKYLLVVTGHQGEPKAILPKIASDGFDFKIHKEDHIIFSCKVIPSPINIANREILEQVLAAKGARIFKDIHVSGHGAREDLRDLIDAVKPKHIIPTHGDSKKKAALADLAVEMGYETEKNVHLMTDGQRKFIE